MPSATDTVHLREMTAADHAEVLRLNEASVHFLSPLDAPALAGLATAAAYARVACDGEQVLAFLLALRPGTGYDSPNYLWFAQRYPRFLYIDRIVVASHARGLGIGQALYADLFAFADRAGDARVTCEYDLDPPNAVSAQFHARLGFVEVGRQRVAGGKKLVSLQCKPLTTPV